ncbi:MAG TPA: ABC transporter permease [Anaerolineales bacterium]|nr:ABC transporter permease [Anaerolineales bacterium]
MSRIFDITLKDLMQIMRNRMTLLFLLIMPIAFTLLFGLAFGGASQPSDSRLPVGYLDQDGSATSSSLRTLLAGSKVVRLDTSAGRTENDLAGLVASNKLAAAVVIPAGYGASLRNGSPLKLGFYADPSQTATSTVESELLVAINKLTSAVRTAGIAAKVKGDPAAFDPALAQALAAWQNPPVQVTVTSGISTKVQDSKTLSLAQSSPAMMIQFAIAGLLTAATVIVNERKTRALQRLLTTSASRFQILMGHYLAIFSIIFIQFLLLITFGQFLQVDYLRLPLATLLVACVTAVCIAALGLLIGVLAKSDEQAIVFSLIPMFVLSGLGGAWMPLEYTGAAFQAIGHVSPVAWAMDGFKNITARGLGFGSVLLPAAALLGYAILFFGLAAWRFQKVSE